MTDKHFHILITGDSGKTRSLVLQKPTVRMALIGTAILLFTLVSVSTQGFNHMQEKRHLQQQVTTLNAELEVANQIVSKLSGSQDKLTADIEKDAVIIQKYQEQIASLKKEHEQLLETSVTRLDERAKIIESVMDRIGVKVKVEEDPDHSGGPFLQDKQYEEKLITDTDRYLKILKNMPLGRPVPNRISSKYGRRDDPFNKKKAFHPGIDFRGKTGDKILATGDATVKRSSYSKGLGNHIILSHNNGYQTVFAHLSKRLVKRGEKINRGQIVGLVGNTGRSTGSHLHYEIRYKGKTVDPMKYIQIANLSMTVKK